jgi:hypothetical protein
MNRTSLSLNTDMVQAEHHLFSSGLPHPIPQSFFLFFEAVDDQIIF